MTKVLMLVIFFATFAWGHYPLSVATEQYLIDTCYLYPNHINENNFVVRITPNKSRATFTLHYKKVIKQLNLYIYNSYDIHEKELTFNTNLNSYFDAECYTQFTPEEELDSCVRALLKEKLRRHIDSQNILACNK